MKIGHFVLIAAVLVAAFLVWKNRAAISGLVSK